MCQIRDRNELLSNKTVKLTYQIDFIDVYRQNHAIVLLEIDQRQPRY